MYSNDRDRLTLAVKQSRKMLIKWNFANSEKVVKSNATIHVNSSYIYLILSKRDKTHISQDGFYGHSITKIFEIISFNN